MVGDDPPHGGDLPTILGILAAGFMYFVVETYREDRKCQANY